MSSIAEIGTPIFEQLNHHLTKVVKKRVCNMKSTYLPRWAEAKSPLFDFLGGKLIVSVPVKSSLPADEVQQIFHEIININKNRRYHLVAKVFRGIHNIEIAQNKLVANLILFGKIFNKGMKVSRVLQEFVLPEDREDFNLKYSMFLQRIKNPNTTLHLSIDPRDFLTMSLNKNNWQTCQHLIEGEYQTAVLSTMVDTSTMIAYISRSEAYYDELDMTWNNKQWRVMVHVNPDNGKAIISSSYPFYNENYEKELQNLLLQLFRQKHGEGFELKTSDYDSDENDSYDLVEVNSNYLYSDLEHKGGLLLTPLNSDEKECGGRIQVGVEELTCICCTKQCTIERTDCLLGHRCGPSEDGYDRDCDDDYK